jgi:hypothetical protein
VTLPRRRHPKNDPVPDQPVGAAAAPRKTVRQPGGLNVLSRTASARALRTSASHPGRPPPAGEMTRRRRAAADAPCRKSGEKALGPHHGAGKSRRKDERLPSPAARRRRVRRRRRRKGKGKSQRRAPCQRNVPAADAMHPGLRRRREGRSPGRGRSRKDDLVRGQRERSGPARGLAEAAAEIDPGHGAAGGRTQENNTLQNVMIHVICAI